MHRSGFKNFYQRNLKPQGIVIALVLGLLALGFNNAGFSDEAPLNPAFQTDFYRFFGPETFFYSELLLPESMKQRLYTAISENKSQKSEDTKAMQAFIDQYFGNQFAVGVSNCKMKRVTLSGQSVMRPDCDWTFIAGLKPGVDYHALAQSLLTKTSKQKEWIIGQSTQKQAVLGLDATHLMMANSTAVLKEAIRQSKETTSIADNPLYEPMLKQLPGNRNGLFLISPTADRFFLIAGKTIDAPTGKAFNKVRKSAEPLFDSLNDIVNGFPGTAGIVQFDGDQQINIESVSPVALEKIQNTALKAALADILTHPVSLSRLASRLPDNQIVYLTVANLSRYLEMIIGSVDWNGTDIQDLKVKGQGYLGMSGLDFHQNILGLFENQFGLALSYDKEIEPFLFFNNTPDTQKTVNKLFAIFKQGQDTQYQEKALDNNRNLQLVRQPSLPITFASITHPQESIMIGTSTSSNSMLEVLSGTRPALSSYPLYQTLTANQPDETLGFLYFNTQQLYKRLESISQVMSGSAAPKSDDKTQSDRKPESHKNDIWQTFEGFAGNSRYDEPSKVLYISLRIKLAPLQSALIP
jgi:Protein of unknown function (DUF3352)